MANPVEPVVCTTDNAYPFRVLPSQRCDRPEAAAGLSVVNSDVYACRDEQNEGLVTLDRTLRVRVKELLYPGDCAVWVTGKWIYVLKEGTYVAEIHSLGEQSWELLRNPDPATPNNQRQLQQSAPGFILLDPGPEGSEYSYDFFISAIRLTPAAMSFLSENAHDSCVSRKFEGQVEAIVAVPDPFHWAADAHNQFYIPRLDRWEKWVNDADQQAKVFIAGVLQALLKDNKTTVKRKLKSGEPDAWLKSYEQRELELRQNAEEAMAYLAYCIDSVEHHAVEIAGMDTGGDALGCCYLQWAAITERVLQVLPGRQFTASAVSNPNRPPSRFLFSETSPVKQLHFEDYRYAWLAALTAFENLVPEKFREFRVKKIPALDRIKGYLAGLDVKTKATKLVGKQKTIARNIERGKPLTSGFGTSAGASRRFEERFNGLLTDATLEAIQKAEHKAGKFSKFIDKVHAEYKGTVFGTKLTLGTVIEIINVANAVNEYLEATGDEKDFHLVGPSKARNLVGTIGDLSVHVADVTKEVFEEQLGTVAKEALHGFGGSAAMISGTVDMLNFEEGMVNEGLAKNDYAVSTGKALSALGSAGLQ